MTDPNDEDSYVNESKKSYYVFMVAAVGILGGYFYLQLKNMGKKDKTPVKVTSQGKADIGGPFELIDTNGNLFGDKDLSGILFMKRFLLFDIFWFCALPRYMSHDFT
jgi:hypothetical protein